MCDQISREKGFVDHFVKLRVVGEHFLSRVDALVDWSPIERVLKKHYKKQASADGRPWRRKRSISACSGKSTPSWTVLA